MGQITSLKKGKILKDHNKDFGKIRSLSFRTLIIVNYNGYLHRLRRITLE